VRERAGAADPHPLFFLHGYRSSSYGWRKTFDQLDGQPVIALDFLDYGLSDKPRDQVYSIKTQASAPLPPSSLAARSRKRSRLSMTTGPESFEPASRSS
jgi:pimeloyl-ACP methyl ester carboxylesterase